MLQLIEARRLGEARWRLAATRKSQQERIELEATVEEIGERRKIAVGVFCEIKGMICATQAGLKITLYRVNPKGF